MPTTPNRGAAIVPLAQHLDIAAGEVRGPAIAMQFTGDTMIYLVADRHRQGAPVWIDESEIESSHAG